MKIKLLSGMAVTAALLTGCNWGQEKQETKADAMNVN